MGVVARRGTESSALVLACENKVDRLSPGEGGGVGEEVKGSEAPVEAVEPKMLRQPVFIFILLGIEALDVFDVGRRCELQLVGQARYF